MLDWVMTSALLGIYFFGMVTLLAFFIFQVCFAIKMLF